MRKWYQFAITSSKSILPVLDILNLENVMPENIKIVKIDQRYLIFYYSHSKSKLLK